MKRTLRSIMMLLAVSLYAAAHGQPGTISGLVLDENSLGMPGATIYIPSLDRGTGKTHSMPSSMGKMEG